jgi:septal ring factor EnvC (AmiA/AmiB activator)
VILPSTSTQTSQNLTPFRPDSALLLHNLTRKVRGKSPFSPGTWLTRILCLALCCLTLADAAYASQQEELDNLRKRIAAVQRNMEKTSESKSEAADSLRESERAISNSNRKLAEISAQQRAADLALGKLQAQLRKLNSDIAVQQTLLGKLLYQQYLGGKQEYLKLLLNSQDPNQIARNLQYYQYIARDRASLLATLRSNLVALDTLSKSTREQREQLASLRAEQASQKANLVKQQHARKRVLGKISLQLRRQRREITRLQHDENRLSRLVNQLSEMLAQPASNSLFHNNKLPDNRFDGRPFDQLKGKLTLPVKGELTNRYGTPRPGSTVDWKGLFLRTSDGQPVKAIAAGRVVFADWLRGFGNLLIIDHGEGYMSLYGNNETLYKQVGDVVRGGDTIAAAGNTGGNENFGLYFELRHESKPLDPMKWMAIQQH